MQLRKSKLSCSVVFAPTNGVGTLQTFYTLQTLKISCCASQFSRVEHFESVLKSLQGLHGVSNPSFKPRRFKQRRLRALKIAASSGRARIQKKLRSTPQRQRLTFSKPHETVRKTSNLSSHLPFAARHRQSPPPPCKHLPSEHNETEKVALKVSFLRSTFARERDDARLPAIPKTTRQRSAEASTSAPRDVFLC